MTASPAAYTFAVVAEAQIDQRTACDLAERVILAEVDWIEPQSLADFCRWRGLDTDTPYLAWKSVVTQARERRIPLHGGFLEKRGDYDEWRAHLALRLFMAVGQPPDGLLLVRDSDGKTGHLRSLERLRKGGFQNFTIVLAVPDPKRECWVLAGFDPRDAHETSRLAELRSRLGYDPRLKAELLKAEGKKGKHNAKKALEQLMTPASAREESCWQDTDLDVLRERGQGSGLTAFLAEVSELLVPLLAGRRGGATPTD